MLWKFASVLLLLAVGDSRAQFADVPAASDDSLSFVRTLPEFEVKDIDGRLWRNDDFGGKFTLVYFWRTSEARAVDAHTGYGQEKIKKFANFPDLTEVQRFSDSLRGRKNLQVLTFCSDYDYTHAPAYMKETKHNFAVIADWKLMETLFGQESRYARYLVVGPEGRVTAPFRYWSFGRLLYELEAVAGR